MWLTNSSLGRKLVMAITGACLVLFVTFHCLMNGVAIFWPSAYNAVCAFLGANWYALIASMGLAVLFIIHILYAVWLTVQNRKARGNDQYAVTSRPKQVEWASKNMLVLGIVIVAFLVLHMVQFWSKMQLAEITGHHEPDPQNGIYFINQAFACWITPVAYIIGFVALWFHMTHGFWSMFQSAGWNNDTWLPRLKKAGYWWTSGVVALFLVQAVLFTVRANNACCDSECPVMQSWNNAAAGIEENNEEGCVMESIFVENIEEGCCAGHGEGHHGCAGHGEGQCAGHEAEAQCAGHGDCASCPNAADGQPCGNCANHNNVNE